MGVAKTPGWVHMLDEIAIHPDPITWTTVGGLRMNAREVWEAFQELQRRGYIERAGVTRDQWQDTLWRLTRKGWNYWAKHVKGRRRRPPSADAVPRWSTAQLALATGPRDVFDLARAPWEWDKGAEQRAFGVIR